MCRSSLLFALCALGLTLAAGCAWQPEAKPIQPQLVLEGSFQVNGVLDGLQRYALVTRDPSDSARRRRLIVDWNRERSCELPEGIVQVEQVLPKGPEPTDGAEFLLPFLVGEEERELWYADQDCKLRGPYGRTSRTSSVLLEETQQAVTLKGNGSGELRLVDPWRDRSTVIATGVTGYTEVRRPEGSGNPQALWVIESGVLTQRTLAGELLLTRGRNVSQFEQALFDTLRVAYVDDGDLYEAAGPDFVPVLIAQDGCDPFYVGVELNLYSPCVDRQLVRIDLTTGQPTLFAPGTIWSTMQSGFLFEYIRNEDDILELYATPPGQARVLVAPTLDDVQVIDAHRIVGRTADDEFGLWDARTGLYLPLVARAGRPIPFVDTRTSELLWLLLHDIEEDVGTLSLFNQKNFAYVDIARDVPTRGFSVELLVQISEPTLVIIEDAAPVSATDQRKRGRLRAQLLSGELGAPIDEGVTSYVSIYAPVPGLLYSVEDGSRSGLWFAAL